MNRHLQLEIMVLSEEILLIFYVQKKERNNMIFVSCKNKCKHSPSLKV
jgi:hypothetical protein